MLKSECAFIGFLNAVPTFREGPRLLALCKLLSASEL